MASKLSIELEVSLYNIAGQEVMKRISDIGSPNIELNLENYPDSFYLIKIERNNQAPI